MIGGQPPCLLLETWLRDQFNARLLSSLGSLLDGVITEVKTVLASVGKVAAVGA